MKTRNTTKLPIALFAAAALCASVLDVRTTNNVGQTGGASTALSFALGARADAFNPVEFVWDKFRKGVLEKVKDFIQSPVEKAKAGLKKLIDGALSKLQGLFTEHVLGPAIKWALEKIFPNAEKILAYAQQVVGKIDTWMNVADKYASAVDALITGQAQKYAQVIGEVDNAMDVVQRFNVTMVVDILIMIAKEKAGAFIRSKALDFLGKAYAMIEGPINVGKAAACTALGSIPVVGGVIRGAADFVITQGLVFLRDKGFEFVADQAVKLGDKVIDAIGNKLKGLAGKVDTAIAPVLDKVKGFVAKVAGYVGPIKDAFAKVKTGLAAAQKAVAAGKAAAQKAAK